MPDDTLTPLETVLDYHRRSKHGLRAYAPGPGHLDWSTQPDPFRRYRQTEHVDLPLLADRLTTSWAALHAAGAVSPHPLDRDGVALLLELSLGLSAWKEYGATRWALRCNPSSGNLHPTEAYLITPQLAGLPRGVYHYLSADHVLERRAVPAAGDWDAALGGGLLLALSSVHWREAWKYGMRAYRYCQHDAGHAIAALCYAAAALGWRLRVLDDWADAEIAALCGIDRAADFPCAEEREQPDCLLWLTPSDLLPPDAGPLLNPLRDAGWQGVAHVLSRAHRAWTDLDAVARAAAKPRTGRLSPWPVPSRPVSQTADTPQTAAALFRQRRSAVAFDGETQLGRAAFFTMLDALLPRAAVPPWDALPWRPHLHPVFFVHRVAGLVPGIYVLPRHAEAGALLSAAIRADWQWQPVDECPAHLPLHLLVAADTREPARLISCHQDIAADSAFALGMLAEYRAGLEQGAWWYRYLYWEAGMLGQVLYLQAEAAGVRATGIGCYFDDEMHRLLGLRDEAFQALYHFTVGGAVEDTRLRTLAPYAHLAPRAK